MKTPHSAASVQPPAIADEDIYRAMEEFSGYVDITPEDFKEIYNHAFQQALRKLSAAAPPAARAASAAQAGGAIPQAATGHGLGTAVQRYLAKMKGAEKSPPKVSAAEMAWSWLGAFLGIAAVAYAHFNVLGATDLVMVIGSFGASAVLIYGAVKSPLAQPRNLLGGHVISAIIGVACCKLLFFSPWLAAAVAVATAIAVMHATKTLHPPGGATALIAVIGSQKIHALGFLYVVVPVGVGALIMLIVALLVNNLAPQRKYPEFWW